jgi:hypothetical protein
MTKPIIPEAALAQLPAYKRDPKNILCLRACEHCTVDFPVAKKFPEARFCSRKCGLAATLPPDHNARIARETATRRGDKLRGRGEGKSYPKLNGRHAHRVAAEMKLGRPLMPGEIAHHIDEDKLNPAPDNIDVMTQAAHASLHFKGRKHSAEHVAKRVASRKKTMAARQGREA